MQAMADRDKHLRSPPSSSTDSTTGRTRRHRSSCSPRWRHNRSRRNPPPKSIPTGGKNRSSIHSPPVGWAKANQPIWLCAMRRSFIQNCAYHRQPSVGPPSYGIHFHTPRICSENADRQRIRQDAPATKKVRWFLVGRRSGYGFSHRYVHITLPGCSDVAPLVHSGPPYGMTLQEYSGASPLQRPTFHSLTVLSLLPEANVWPSRAKARQ